VSEAPVLAVGERRGRGGKISGRPRALYAPDARTQRPMLVMHKACGLVAWLLGRARNCNGAKRCR
jgi:hypothetical protein